MSALTYLDFDLEIDEATDGAYRARVLGSPAGQAETIFSLPFSVLEIENFLLRIGRPRRGVRRIQSPEMNEVRRFGADLYAAVFQGEIARCLLRSIDVADQQEQGVRLRLRLPPSLIELPWEFLYDGSHERFLAHSIGTPIVRFLDLPQRLEALTVTPPLNVLVMIANPSDFELLDVEAEWQKLKQAVAVLEERGLLTLTRLSADGQEGATLAALQKRLRQAPYHIFHFIGHGGFDQQTQDGVLLLEAEDGRSRLVSGNYLGTLLHDESSLRLAFLNACEGARTTQSDPFAGVAQELVRQGIPAVIAMQFEITDDAAVQLTREFYGALVDGYPVDGALAEARKALFTAGNDIEWGTPVLYLRATDGRLFDVVLQDHPPAPHLSVPIAVPTVGDGASVPLPAVAVGPVVGGQWRRLRPGALLAILLVIAGGFWLWSSLMNGTDRSTIMRVDTPTEAATTTINPVAAPALNNLTPISRTLWLSEASALVDSDEYAAAETIYTQLLTADATDVEALLGLAWVLRFTPGREQDALRRLNQAVTFAPNDPNVNAALGDLLRETFNRPAEAIPYYSQAISNTVPTRRAPLYAARAWAHDANGDLENAVADWDAAIALDPTSDGYIQRAKVHQALPDEAAAEADYTNAIKLAPELGKYYFARAEFYAAIDRSAEAVADYQKFLDLPAPPDIAAEAVDQAQRYLADHATTSPAP